MTQVVALPAARFPALGSIDHYDPDAQLSGNLPLVVKLLTGLLALLLACAALVPIGGAVIGGGEVGVEARVKQIAHPIGGTVAQILVRNGQHVRKGQVLLRLDDRVTGADAEYSALSLDQMLAQKARLEAEQNEAAGITFPPALAVRQDESAQRAMAEEQRLFAIRRAERATLGAQMQARMSQSREQITGYQSQIASLRQQAALIENERKGIQSLYDRKLVTITRYNQVERQAAEITGSVASLQAQIAQTRAHMTEIGAQMIQLGDTRRTDAGTQLAAINAQLNQQRVRSIAATDTQERTVIRATQDGVVDKLAVATIGGVIRPAEVLMVIVPDGGKSGDRGQHQPVRSRSGPPGAKRAPALFSAQRCPYARTDRLRILCGRGPGGRRQDRPPLHPGTHRDRSSLDEEPARHADQARPAGRNLHRDRLAIDAVVHHQTAARPVLAQFPRQLTEADGRRAGTAAYRPTAWYSSPAASAVARS